jgi:hypothetical protein
MEAFLRANTLNSTETYGSGYWDEQNESNEYMGLCHCNFF